MRQKLKWKYLLLGFRLIGFLVGSSKPAIHIIGLVLVFHHARQKASRGS
jgi:hypothetical protein